MDGGQELVEVAQQLATLLHLGGFETGERQVVGAPHAATSQSKGPNISLQDSFDTL